MVYQVTEDAKDPQLKKDIVTEMPVHTSPNGLLGINAPKLVVLVGDLVNAHALMANRVKLVVTENFS